MRYWTFALSIALVVAGGSGSAVAADSDGPVIVVVGHGAASAPADFAQVDFTVRGEGKSSVDALRALAERRAAIESKLGALAGAAGVKIGSSRMLVSEARTAACREANDSNSPPLSAGECAVLGYVAQLNESVAVHPAEKAGNAASLAAELGATDVNLETTWASDPAALRNAAAKAAVEDAQRQAGIVAAASGGRLGPIIRIQDNESRQDAVNEFVVTAQRKAAVSPIVAIDFRPAPISKSAELTVTYSLVR